GRLWFAARLYPAARDAVRAIALPLAVGGIGLAALLAFGSYTTLAVVALVAIAAFTAAVALALTPQERRDARVLLRRPGRIRAVLKGEPA
ncbi:hypothetical protein, partial [Falsiroseomonas oryziterrae]|uniref:hypothetical protein n=1 Tax=Falsiroseomonas oryziterrae TaxID=2911368 RepID=UPI001F1BCC0F